jgi:SAM-dependent methyltransferase
VIWAVLIGVALLLLLVAGVVWLRTHPSPLPYNQRFLVRGPHPGLGRERLREVLEPRPGERLLEVGPGTGYHSLPIASWISPGGTLEIVDVIQEWLDHTMRVAREQGIENIVPTLADATSLPHQDGSFHAAFLVQVVGEVPDQEAALRELRRVLSPDGRLIVGECVLDPHVVPLPTLRRRAGRAGLRFDGAAGGRFSYFARFRPEAP